MEIRIEQALQVLLENGIMIAPENGAGDFWSSVISTLLGVVAGGIITIVLSKRSDVIASYKAIELELARASSVFKEIIRKLEDKGCYQCEFEKLNKVKDDIDWAWTENNTETYSLAHDFIRITEQLNYFSDEMKNNEMIILKMKALDDEIIEFLNEVRGLKRSTMKRIFKRLKSTLKWKKMELQNYINRKKNPKK